MEVSKKKKNLKENNKNSLENSKKKNSNIKNKYETSAHLTKKESEVIPEAQGEQTKSKEELDKARLLSYYNKLKEIGEGAVFKNYKELCCQIGAEEYADKTSKSKRLFLNKLGLVCKIEKIEGSQKYQLIKLNEGVDESTVGVIKQGRGDKSTESKSIEMSIAWKMWLEVCKSEWSGYERGEDNKEVQIQVTKTQIADMAGLLGKSLGYVNRQKEIQEWYERMINLHRESKKRGKDRQNKTSNRAKYQWLGELAEGVVDGINAYCSDVVRKTIIRMQKRGVIKNYKIIKIVLLEGGGKRIATEQDLRKLESVEKEIKKKMGIYVGEVPYGMLKLFYDRVNMKLQQKYGWNRVYEAFVIESDYKSLVYYLESICQIEGEDRVRGGRQGRFIYGEGLVRKLCEGANEQMQERIIKKWEKVKEKNNEEWKEYWKSIERGDRVGGIGDIDKAALIKKKLVAEPIEIGEEDDREVRELLRGFIKKESY